MVILVIEPLALEEWMPVLWASCLVLCAVIGNESKTQVNLNDTEIPNLRHLTLKDTPEVGQHPTAKSWPLYI